MALRVLSIDGGGMRGIIPLLILAELEKLLGKPIGDVFDLIAGTSTGGLIACGLALQGKKGEALFSASELLRRYEENAKLIFPKQKMAFWAWPRALFWPRYSEKGLESVLLSILGETRLLDCRVPILVTAYDIRNHRPVYFTSRMTDESSGGDKRLNYRLTDICRATSAAPTYFRTHEFEGKAFENGHDIKMNCIDGGVFMNNPALAATLELTRYGRELHYTRGKPERTVRDRASIEILSLGTGFTSNTILKEVISTGWGKIGWAFRITDIMMRADNQVIDQQLEELLKQNYCRVKVSLAKFMELDDTKETAVTYWKDETRKQVMNDATVWERVIKFIEKP